MASRIICVGVNPAFDTTLWLSSLEYGDVSRAYKETKEAAGKALNVCCELTRLGSSAIHLCFLGAENSDDYMRLQSKRGAVYECVAVNGRTRENLTLLVDGKDKEIKINRTGFSVSSKDIEKMEDAITGGIKRGADTVIFSGSMPEGMSSEQYFGLMMSAKNAGARVAVDTEAISPDQLRTLAPWAYKPNAAEFRRMFSLPASTDVAVLASGALLLSRSGIENVLLTLGAEGLLLVRADGIIRVKGTTTDMVNSVGAGDRALAGFTAAYLRGDSPEKCAQTADKSGRYINK